MAIATTKVYTVFSYEDNEVKDVFSSLEDAKEWIQENRSNREDDVRIEEWVIDIELAENESEDE